MGRIRMKRTKIQSKGDESLPLVVVEGGSWGKKEVRHFQHYTGRWLCNTQ